MDSVVMDWIRIGLAAVGFILVLKLVFLRFQVPGVTPAVASI